MADHDAALRISNLRTRYGDRDVLRGLTLTVEPAMIYGLLGPNGAGKTTLIRTICGRINPVGGSVEIAGKPNTERGALRNIGLVPQEIALYAHMTVRENLEVFGRLSGLSRKQTQESIAWLAEAAHLASRMQDRVEILSGGWKRRVNIAAAILHDPALLILDEPTVGVDVDARNGLHELILELSHSGMGILLTTHDMEQAETLCSTVGFLHSGIVAPQGHPRDLVEATYHDCKEVILELRQTPTAEQHQLLYDIGFSPFNSVLSWSKFEHPAHISATHITRDFERHGMSVREVRLRDPGLDSLFIHLNRDAQPAATQGAA